MFSGLLQLSAARRDRENHKNPTQEKIANTKREELSPKQPQKVFYYGTTKEKAEILQATKMLPQENINSNILPVSGVKMLAEGSAIMESVKSKLIHSINGESNKHEDQATVLKFTCPAEELSPCKPYHTTMPTLGIISNHFDSKEIKTKDYGFEGTHHFITKRGLGKFDMNVIKSK